MYDPYTGTSETNLFENYKQVSMRVMCINDNWRPHASIKNCACPVFFEECEVAEEKQAFGLKFFLLAGRFDPSIGYLSSHFAILPDHTADEVDEQEKEAIINLETV